MYTRAADKSNNELENAEDVCFSGENTKSSRNSAYNSTFEKIEFFDQDRNSYFHDEHRTFQLRVINACMMGHLEIIQEYLKRHNVNDSLNTGWTPLIYAASYAQSEVIEHLLINGADVNKHRDGYTPLMALCNSTKGSIESRLKCLSILLKAEPDVDAIGKQSETAIMYACKTQSSEFVAELIKYVRDVNLYDSAKKTALMYAVMANKPNVVKLLLDNAADATLIDNNNLTAQDMAIMKGYTEILSLFNYDENDVTTTHEVFQIYNWKDMYPILARRTHNTIDFDISTILYGMGLETYTNNFKGLVLKSFLKLTEDELNHLGIDINAHRKQFMEKLHKFHTKKWNSQSISVINKSLPYTIYDGVVSLGTITKHMTVIGSSFQYIKHSLSEADVENLCLTRKEVSRYEQEVKKTQEALCTLQKEVLKLKTTAQMVDRTKNLGKPAVYINPRKNTMNWPVMFNLTLIIGMCFYKIMNVQNVPNN